MSRVKEQLENIEWDLHEQPQQEEQKPIELSGEISPDIFGIEPIKAQEMVSGLSTVFAEREVLKNAYIDVIELLVNTENLPVFKELRLKIVKNRTQGIEKWHKTNKAFYLAGGRFVDAIKNKEVLENEQMESKLLEAEKFFENQEKEKARVLNCVRLNKLKPYVEDTVGLDFAPMSDEDFDDYLLGKKTRFENAKKEEEEKAEAELVEKRKNETLQKRQIEIAPYLQFISDAPELKEMPERLYQDLLHNCQKAKIKFDEEVDAQRIDNEKLKKEAEEKEALLQKERTETARLAKIEADKQAKIQADKDAEIKKEREAKEKLEAEIRAKKDAEIKAEAVRIAEAVKLAKAPIKKQLSTWVESFSLPVTSVDNEVSKEIKEKFEAFKKWSLSQVNNL